ncbi:hypothetical protein NQ314_007456 [Rhamnusium bicolor]|uniref:Adenylate kinase 7 n=1 Tax=Rhamnusium bicolor TaxID=1586634 RepID=A0AAV8YNI8_9CUCU|nr:hypothetical protein NQ314_007456 [Rhamnusium bicolor]
MDKPNVQPLKAIIHGPPASGKTRLAKRLCQRYGAHYVSVRTMIEETLEILRENIAREEERKLLQAIPGEKEAKEDIDEEAEDEEELGEEEEGGGPIEGWQEQIRDITMLMAKSENGKLPDQYAKELFGQAAETGKQMDEGGKAGIVAPGEGGPGEGAIGGEDQVGGLIGNASNRIMPDFVISLQATDDFLCERIMKLPEREIQGTHYDEPNMIRRLAEFRENNMEETTILKFFDEAEIHPILIDLVDEITEEEKDFECILAIVTDILGEPIPGFGLTPEEIEELRRLEMEHLRLLEEEGRLKKRKQERNTKTKWKKWAETLEKLQMEEEKILAAQSEPLRFYLMKYIFPTLTKGMLEVAKIKPDDPVDFLAEFLFRENPEGKMFDPSYTRDGEKLLQQYEKEVEPSLVKNCMPDK